MFSGIVEAVSPVLEVQTFKDLVRIQVERPPFFDDIKTGDSIAVNGVCLTVEAFTERSIQFALAFETLRVLNIQPEKLQGSSLNLERSLRFGDRIHGHLVTGHVEALGKVIRSEGSENSWFLTVSVPETLLPFLWKKGSITLHGVSLTVNDVKEENQVEVCLIPETLKRTNLGRFKVGDVIHIEPDYMAKAMVRALETGVLHK